MKLKLTALIRNIVKYTEHIICNKLSLVERLKLCQKPFSAYIIIIAKCFRNHILNTQAVLVSQTYVCILF